MIDRYEEALEDLLASFDDDPAREGYMNLLADAFYDNLQRGESEYGGWGLDDKRPFGHSAPTQDIAELTGFAMPEYNDGEEEYEDACRYLNSLYDDLGTYLRYKWNASKRQTINLERTTNQ